MVTDENGHLWVAASSNEAGKIIEINPDTHAKISDIGKSKLETIWIFRVLLGYLEKFFKGYAFMQICSKFPIEKMFALYFFVRALIVLIQLVDKSVHPWYE